MYSQDVVKMILLLSVHVPQIKVHVMECVWIYKMIAKTVEYVELSVEVLMCVLQVSVNRVVDVLEVKVYVKVNV